MLLASAEVRAQNNAPGDAKVMQATDFPIEGTPYYVNQNWLAINNPDVNKEAETRAPFPYPSGKYDVVLFAVGESDGRSEYWVSCNDQQIGHFAVPLSSEMFEEGKKFNVLWKNVAVENGDAISVKAKVGTDGQEFSRGRWAGLAFVPVGQGDAALAMNISGKSAAVAQPADALPSSSQAVGLRFQNLKIPAEASVKSAYIQFTVDEAQNADPFKIKITGQAADNTNTFGTGNFDVSKRPRTEASAVWKDIPAWQTEGEAGPNQRTTDLKNVVNEIVGRSGWSSGNAMAFILEGTGIRTAISHEKSPEKAPKLVVTLASGDVIESIVTSDTDDMEEKIAAGGSIDHPSSDLELGREEITTAVASAGNASPQSSGIPVEKLKIKNPINKDEFFSPTDNRKPDGNGSIEISGELRQWHKITLTLDGPFAHELDDSPNPFLDYRMTVEFQHESGEPTFNVPGYFAADGDAANSGADSGTKWRAHFAPDKTGSWNYKVSFVEGNQVAVSDTNGRKLAKYDGKSGSFNVAKTDKTGRDMRAKGRLEYVGEHYLQFAGNGEYFIKNGADAPENLFAYADFDGTFKVDGVKDELIKTWEPHVKDWQEGDPSWQDGKGKGLIGAINYLASEGLNAFSFLTMNIAGDDCNVFPYTTYEDRVNLDVSRLDQWEIVFEHGTAKGMFLHFKTMETENEMLLDNGNLGPERKLYYRELIARFGHHPALNWNLGEEINEANTKQKASWARYLHDTDPYTGHIVIHNMGNPHYDLLGPDFALTGFSLQTSNPDFKSVHARTLDYINRSAAAGKKWAVACDEPGDATHSLVPDWDGEVVHRDARVNGLWGHYLAGGYGLEWYFGYDHDHSDLTCQDWRSRDKFWDCCRYALEFFAKQELPLTEMTNADDLAEGDAYVFRKLGGPYVVMLKTGGAIELDLSEASGNLAAEWFNPRTGEYSKGGTVKAGGKIKLGPAPAEPDLDWVVTLK
jgi:hypothetical protein